MRELDDVTAAIVDAAVGLHRDLGPGLLESVYEAILAAVLQSRGLEVQRQEAVACEYRGIKFADAFRADLIIDRQVIIELKAVEKLAPVHAKQLLTYLRLSGLKVGFVMNFGAPTLKEGLKRVVNDLDPSASSRLRVNRS
jgi:GxxExxY protein